MKCEEYRDLMSQYFDQKLSLEEEKAFEAHMASCEDCKHEYNMFIEIMATVHDIEEVELPKDFHKDIMSKIEIINKTKSDESKNKVQPIHRFKKKWFASAAVAACLTFVVLQGGVLEHTKSKDESIQEFSVEMMDEAKNESSEGRVEAKAKNTSPVVEKKAPQAIMENSNAEVKQKEDKNLDITFEEDGAEGLTSFYTTSNEMQQILMEKIYEAIISKIDVKEGVNIEFTKSSDEIQVDLNYLNQLAHYNKDDSPAIIINFTELNTESEEMSFAIEVTKGKLKESYNFNLENLQ